MKKKKILLIITVLLLTCFININGVKAVDVVICGNLGEQGIPAGIPRFTRNVYTLIQIVVPVAIIILGIVDMAKAVTASDEKVMKESQSKLIRRLIAGVIILFVLTIVKTAFKLANFEDSSGILACISCLSSDERDCTPGTLTEEGIFEEDSQNDSTTHTSSSGETHGGSSGKF